MTGGSARQTRTTSTPSRDRQSGQPRLILPHFFRTTTELLELKRQEKEAARGLAPEQAACERKDRAGQRL